MDCTIYMGAVDVERQAPNVSRMKLLGAELVPVTGGTRTLKDAINETLRAWIVEQADTHYCFGTVAGPHPFPTLVRDLQAVIGRERKEQAARQIGRMPDAVLACVGGGSNAIGMFHPFASDPDAAAVRLIGIEAGGTGEPGCYTSAPLNLGRPGVLHGQFSMLLQNEDGQIEPSHSVSAGLDYPGVGPEHAWLQRTGRAEYHIVTDASALRAFEILSRKEGIIPALESSHALAFVLDNPSAFAEGSHVVVSLSGRGDKDLGIASQHLALLQGAATCAS
jgi:tryptophan synthase beta chain